MRPVNLIPPEERRGDRAPTRTGPVSYILVGALALAVAGVSAVVLTSNQIADRTEQVAALEAREAAAAERAEALASYAEFASMKEARAMTVDSLARSRFDWERVLRELALVIPAGIELSGVNGSVAPGVTPEGGAEVNSLRSAAPGPALEIAGCAGDHESVAALAAALEDIDGVTRVAVNKSEHKADSAAAAAEATGSGGTGCADVPGVTLFEMIAAFDEVPAPPTAVPAPGAAPAAPPAAPADSSVADAQAAGQEAEDSAADQTEKAQNAADLVPGVAR